ncbi:ATP-binding cassette domain-containing protein [Microbispora sp. ATCC PTA-5024]|uniref:ATP-binding cassette domain-containing protein n=1 Tax=Microbispora sp. ATCC PTA-5024 TaxID=316330 RepID=UPI0003DD3C12|nr:ATP-binding cassette domain-containing protein [Microbispora sp. ATCC PTA-5024]ETK34047.1 ABC transporter ATP binding domain [Microbispora sp. ATCC PTA-5024]
MNTSISITDLTKRYRRGGERPALNGVSLTVDGGMTALLGANGAGKTTLMRICVGVLRPDGGRVVVGGHDLGTAAGRRAVKRVLGYLPQELSMYDDLTGREFLDYIALLKGVDDKRVRRDQIEQMLELTGLSEHAGRRLGGYSGGMKRRLGIAQALLAEPELIVVDEPTAGLDPSERMRFRSLLAGLGGARRTVVLSTHILDDAAQTCPNTIVLHQGRVAYQGSTAGLAAVAEGRTYLLPPGAQAPPEAVVVNAAAEVEGTRYRVISARPPIGGTLMTPTLEDGYAALLQLGEPSPTGPRP